VFLRSVLQLLVIANVLPNLLILSIQLVFLHNVLPLLVTAKVVPSLLILSIYLMFLGSVLQLLVTAYSVPSSLILSTLMIEQICSIETSVLTRETRRHIPEDCIFLSSNSFSYISCIPLKYDRYPVE
jgi:hypothetical protein